jgi:DNA-binding response OmpR family regulator
VRLQETKATTRVHVLVVEDQSIIRTAMVRALNTGGYYADGASSGEEALQMLATFSYDVMVLDLHLPGVNGEDVMREVHQAYPDLQIIVLTAHASLESAIAAVRAGAADYLIKPSSLHDLRRAIDKALQARAEHLHRRQLVRVLSGALEALQGDGLDVSSPQSPETQQLRRGTMTLNLQKRIVVFVDSEGQRLRAELTANEAQILAYLMRHVDQVCSCRELARLALGYDVEEREAQDIIRPHISRLRSKIEPQVRPTLIRTIRGEGYLYSPPKP